MVLSFKFVHHLQGPASSRSVCQPLKPKGTYQCGTGDGAGKREEPPYWSALIASNPQGKGTFPRTRLLPSNQVWLAQPHLQPWEEGGSRLAASAWVEGPALLSALALLPMRTSCLGKPMVLKAGAALVGGLFGAFQKKLTRGKLRLQDAFKHHS